MLPIKFVSLPTGEMLAFQAGAADANGQPPEPHISDGDGVPCRHCQADVAKGEPYLILAYRPFPRPQPYAETGPVFLHAAPCPRYPLTDSTPTMFHARERFLVKGYGRDDRIVYGTGRIVASADAAAAAETLQRPDIAYVHVRSALNNCFQCRIERA